MTPSATTVRRAAVTAAVLCTGTLLAACGSVNQNSAAAGHGAASPQTSATALSAQGARDCAAAALTATVNVANGGAAAGSAYYPLTLTNTSGAACTLSGYPAVAFVTGKGGAVIGRQATTNKMVAPAPVTLAPGAAAHATVQIASAGNYGAADCVPVSAHWLRIVPPHAGQALYVNFTTRACSARLPRSLGSQLSVSAVAPGAH